MYQSFSIFPILSHRHFLTSCPQNETNTVGFLRCSYVWELLGNVICRIKLWNVKTNFVAQNTEDTQRHSDTANFFRIHLSTTKYALFSPGTAFKRKRNSTVSKFSPSVITYVTLVISTTRVNKYRILLTSPPCKPLEVISFISPSILSSSFFALSSSSWLSYKKVNASRLFNL